MAELMPITVITTTLGSDDAPRITRRGALTVKRERAIEVAHTPISPGLVIALARSRPLLFHVHISQVFVQDAAALIGLLLHTPYIAHYHLDVQPSGRFGWIFRIYKRTFLPQVLRRAAAVIVLTEDQRIELEASGVRRDRIRVIANAVERRDSGGARLRRPDGPVRLLFVGRLVQQKNADLLLDVAARLGTNCEVVVVGEGEERARLEGDAKARSLSQVRFVGQATPETVPGWYDWADLLVMPSSVEGLPLVLLEALASGLPVIASDRSGLAAIVGGAGTACEPEPAAFAAAILQLWERADDYQLASALAVDQSKLYSWERLIEEVSALYQHVLEET
jgi:glycosyltransferase involved in cell wall biosynthesis